MVQLLSHRQQRSPHQQRGYYFLDSIAKRCTNKLSSLIICDQQSIAHRLGTQRIKFIKKKKYFG